VSSDDRRGGERHLAWFPIRIEGEDIGEGIAIAKNVSTGGLLIASPQKLIVGAPVKLSLHLDPKSDQAREVTGTVVRMEVNDADPEGLWPHRLGVEFDDPDPELLAEIISAVLSEDGNSPNVSAEPGSEASGDGG
jgi:hypothetical protein